MQTLWRDGLEEDVANTSSGFATADIYGKLFYYIRGLLRSFLDRLSSSTISFKLFQLDVKFLHEHLASDTFNRVRSQYACINLNF